MEFKTKSGASIVVNVAPFEDALLLQNLVGNPAMSIRTDVGPEFDIDNTAAAHFMAVVASRADVQAQVMKCLARCSYNGLAINSKTFEAEAAREDYFEIAVACIQENLSPFVKSLFLQLSGVIEAMKKNPAVFQK